MCHHTFYRTADTHEREQNVLTNRLDTMVFLVLSIYWSTLLALWPLQGAAKTIVNDACHEEKLPDELWMQMSSGEESYLDLGALKDTFKCLLYQTNLLNCSWSFVSVKDDTHLSVSVSVCNDNITVQSLHDSSVKRAGSRSLTLQHNPDMLYIVLQFNMTEHNEWKTYNYIYNRDLLEVLPPSPNVSAIIKDGNLLVTWALPQAESEEECFGHQLDLGDQNVPRNVTNQLIYKEPSVDPTHTYRVRIRTRKLNECFGSFEWSEWSPTLIVEQSPKLNTTCIIFILCGIPMILLAVLLIVYHQRMLKFLLPPIPCPAPRYIYFLEKSDTFTDVHHSMSFKYSEEVTIVEEIEKNPEKIIEMCVRL